MHLKFNNWDKYNKRQKDIKRPYWFAMSNEFFFDPDLYNFSDRERLVLIYLLCLASKSNKYGEFIINEELFIRTTGFSKQNLYGTVDKLLLSKAAAECRQDGGVITTATRQDKTEQDKGMQGDSTPIGAVAEQGDGPTADKLVDLWNEAKHNDLPAVKDLTASRIRKAQKILKKYPDADFWVELITKINNSKFCTGKIKPKEGTRTKAWRATFDWVLKEDTIAKILEGQYDDK